MSYDYEYEPVREKMLHAIDAGGRWEHDTRFAIHCMSSSLFLHQAPIQQAPRASCVQPLHGRARRVLHTHAVNFLTT